MKILLVSRYPGFAISYSRIAYDIALHLGKEGHQVTVLAFGNSRQKMQRYCPFEIVLLPEKMMYQTDENLQVYNQIIEDGMIQEPDLIFGIEDIETCWLIDMLRFRYHNSKTLIYTMFDGKPVTHSAVFKGKVKTYNSVFNKIDKILVPTEFSKNIFDWLGGTKAEVLPLYYDENIFKSIPELKSYQTQPFVFLSVSRNTTRKNLGNLLVGFKQFLDQGYNAHLRLRTELEVHDSTSFNLQGLAHSLRLGKHITADRFHPAIGHRQADLVMSYNTSDCGIYASTREGFCMPALESMACGIPVVITEKTAMDSWVPEEMTRVHSSATFVNALASTEEVIATPDDIELAMTVAYNRYYGKTNHREEIRKAVEPMRLSLFLKRLDKILQEL